MKQLVIGFFLIFLNQMLLSQITMQTNLPPVIATDAEIKFDVRLNKGTVSGFAKYQIDVPQGVTIKEVECRAGSFSFENNRAKIVWVMVPTDPEFVITLKLISVAMTGTSNVNQRFYYLQDGTRKDSEADPITITFSEAGVKSNPSSLAETPAVIKEPITKPIEQSKPKETSPAPVVPVTAAKPNTANKKANELIQQALQLKKDASDAFEIGQKEKKEADKKLEEANAAIKSAEAITDQDEKKAALEKANAMKLKAENNQEIASKILVLAKSLDDNANDIERLVQRQGQVPTSSTSVASKNSAKQITKDMSRKDIEEFKQQAAQLKKDAKDASEIGEKEKLEADKKIAEASDAIKSAEALSGEEERKIALEKANLLKQKGEADYANASKILDLSKTLENNANEIERLIEKFYAPSIPVASNTIASTNASGTNLTNQNAATAKPVAVENGIVFKVQIGAFLASPEKSKFKNIGKFNIVNEDEKYKVLVGSFASREEAVKKREELTAKGFDGFIVSYKDGTRVK